MMFPYPSAEGLHVGNLFAFTGADVHGRFMRLQGHTVFEPLGYDAFGIHSENYALKVGAHPMTMTPRNVANFRRQLGRAGLMVDWRTRRHVAPRLLPVDAVGLPAAPQAGARLQEGGGGQLVPHRQDRARQRAGRGRAVRAVRHARRAALPGAVVLPHLGLRRAAARQPRLARLERDHQGAQRNWIGRSEGAEVAFAVEGAPEPVRVFTTRVDTLFGATYLVLAPEHPLVARSPRPTAAPRSTPTARAPRSRTW
jgi:leucyl-tRNA synthetase